MDERTGYDGTAGDEGTPSPSLMQPWRPQSSRPYLDHPLHVRDVDAEARLPEDLDARPGPGHEHELGAAAQLVVADGKADEAVAGLGLGGRVPRTSSKDEGLFL